MLVTTTRIKQASTIKVVITFLVGVVSSSGVVAVSALVISSPWSQVHSMAHRTALQLHATRRDMRNRRTSSCSCLKNSLIDCGDDGIDGGQIYKANTDTTSSSSLSFVNNQRTDDPPLTLTLPMSNSNDERGAATQNCCCCGLVMEDPSTLPRTIAGGESMIFAMAPTLFTTRNDELYYNAIPAHSNGEYSSSSSSMLVPSEVDLQQQQQPQQQEQQQRQVETDWMLREYDDCNKSNQTGNNNKVSKNINYNLVNHPLKTSNQQQQQQQQQPYIGGSIIKSRQSIATLFNNHDNTNYNFRHCSPKMTIQEYGHSIRRYSRKHNMPSMWKYALRLYYQIIKMQQAEAEASVQQAQKEDLDIVMMIKSDMKCTNIHYESVLVACSKLGNWKDAMSIFRSAVDQQQRQQQEQQQQQLNRQKRKHVKKIKQTKDGITIVKKKKKLLKGHYQQGKEEEEQVEGGEEEDSDIHITKNMIMNVIQSCVRASRQKSRASLPQTRTLRTTENDINLGNNASGTTSSMEVGVVMGREERRRPLDAARDLLLRLEHDFDTSLEARFVNPIAAAYQSLGYCTVADALIQDNLVRPRRYDGDTNVNELLTRNVNANINAVSEKTKNENCNNEGNVKDEGSYSILVKGAVANADWTKAVSTLKEMTEAGLYPKSRSLNSWHEASVRKNKSSHSWKKKRDESWVTHGQQEN